MKGVVAQLLLPAAGGQVRLVLQELAGLEDNVGGNDVWYVKDGELAGSYHMPSLTLLVFLLPHSAETLACDHG